MSKKHLEGMRFGKLTVIRRSDKRGSRGARTVPLWECLCDCGETVYKATDTLTNSDISMCESCAKAYAVASMSQKAGYLEGTQLTKIINSKPQSPNGKVRGVYFEKSTGRWRARLRFKGKLMNFGSYTNQSDAIKARKKAEDEIFGEFISTLKANS